MDDVRSSGKNIRSGGRADLPASFFAIFVKAFGRAKSTPVPNRKSKSRPVVSFRPTNGSFPIPYAPRAVRLSSLRVSQNKQYRSNDNRRTTCFRSWAARCKPVGYTYTPYKNYFRSTGDRRSIQNRSRRGRRWSLIDSRTRNDSSDLIKTLNAGVRLQIPVVKRRFSDMNVTITESRARLTVENVSDLTVLQLKPSVHA